MLLTCLYFTAHLDEDVINSYSKTKGKLWNQSRIDIEKRSAVPYLLRELARRKAIAGGDITDILKMPKKITREAAMKELLKYPLDDGDKRFVVNAWNHFLGQIRDYYAKNARTSQTKLLQDMRKIETFLLPELRDAFKKYKSQPKRHETDARNSEQAVPSFYSIVAKAHNRATDMWSRSLAERYGYPFDTQKKLVAPKRPMTAYEARVFLNGLKRPFCRLQDNLVASGNGEEHELKRFVEQVCEDDNGNVVANSEMVGYAYGCFEEEELLHLVTQRVPKKDGGTMKFVPMIAINDTSDMNDDDFGDGDANGDNNTTTKKRNRPPRKSSYASTSTASTTRKKKARSSEGNDSVAFQLLQQLKSTEQSMRIQEKMQELAQAKQELNHLKAESRNCQKWVWEVKAEMRSSGLSMEEIQEEEVYKRALAQVDENGVEVSKQSAVVEKVKLELDELKNERDTVVSSNLFGVDDDVKTPARKGSKQYELYRQGRDFETESLDGSNGDLDHEYQIETMDEQAAIGEENEYNEIQFGDANEQIEEEVNEHDDIEM